MKEQKKERSPFVTTSIRTKVFLVKIHNQFPTLIIISKHYRNSSLSRLLSNNYLTGKRTYACSFCLNHVKKLQKETSPETAKEDSS